LDLAYNRNLVFVAAIVVALLSVGRVAGQAAEPGPINKLAWQTTPAEVRPDGTLAAPRPSAEPRVFYFTATTADGLMISSPAVIRPER